MTLCSDEALHKKGEKAVYICTDAEVEVEISVTLLGCALLVVLRRNKRVAIKFPNYIIYCWKS